MSSEFPPIIIDGSGTMIGDEGQIQSVDGISIRGARLTQGPDGTLTVYPSLVTLYLVKDTRLLYQGEYRSEELHLLYGEEAEQVMAVGGVSMALRRSDDDEGGVQQAPGLIHQASTQVKAIRIPGRTEVLEAGRDFDNFIVIIQRKG